MVRGDATGDIRIRKRLSPESDGAGEDVLTGPVEKVAKRAKAASVERPFNPYHNFRPGNLVRIRMKSFVTFADVTVEPSPRLNVVCPH